MRRCPPAGKSSFITVLALLLVVSRPAADPQIVITDLPSLGFTWTSGDAINAAGQIAGWATTIGPPAHAMMWTNDQPTDLGALCATCNSNATDINASGVVVGWSTTPADPNGAQVPVVWSNGGIAPLPLLPGDFRGTANGVNDAGVVVGSSQDANAVSRIVRWTNGVADVLGVGSARAINNAGQILASISGTGTAIIQPNGSITPLLAPPGACSNSRFGAGINDSGQVVGFVSMIAPPFNFCSSVPATWINGQVTLLPGPGGVTGGNAVGINNHGDIVGRMYAPGGPLQAYLWRDGQAINLGTLPFPLPVQAGAQDINDAGVIAGFSRIDRVSFPATTRAVTFKVIEPNTPPSLNLPANMTVNADSPAGAIVFFTATADDAEDGTFNATCTPASGSQFAIGTTTVSCTATDSGGLDADGSFSITVKGAASQVQDVATSLGVSGPGGSFQNKLSAIMASVSSGDGQPCAKLHAFINEVSAQSGKKLTAAQAAQLIAAAQRIRGVIGCQ